MKRPLGTAVMIAGLSLPVAAQEVGDRGMSGTEPRSTMNPVK